MPCVYRLARYLNLSRVHGVDSNPAMSFVGQTGHPSVADIHSLVNKKLNVEGKGGCYRPEFLELIDSSEQAICTDPHDRIYGVFGLLDSQDLPMQPDYNLTTDELSLIFTTGLIQTSRRLDVVSLANYAFGNTVKRHLPSWVPDYGLQVREGEISSLMPTPHFSAAADLGAEFSFRGLGILCTKSILCGEVLEISHSESDNLLASDDQEWVWEWLALAKANSKDDYPTGIPWRQTFFRTLIHDDSASRFRASGIQRKEDERTLYNRAEGFMTFMRFLALEKVKPFIANDANLQQESDEIPQSSDVLTLFDLETLQKEQKIGDEVVHWLCNSSTTGDEVKRKHLLELFCGKQGIPNALQWPFEEYACWNWSVNTDSFVRAMRVTTSGRALFVTRSGYMGLAPRWAKKGDFVCVLPGCGVPLLIRKMESDYVILGDTYVYGMMHGEVVEKSKRGEFQIQDLTFQ
jgi:hypothetical protein